MGQSAAKRIALIDKETDMLRSGVEHLATKLSLFLTGWFAARWILDDDKNISDEKANYDTINKLAEAQSSFFNDTIIPFLTGIALVFFDIQSLTKKYFQEVEEDDIEVLEREVKPQPQPKKEIPPEKKAEVTVNECLDNDNIIEQISASFGFAVKDAHVQIEPEGWLANIGDLTAVYGKVRETAMKAVIGRQGLDAFLKTLKKEIQGDDRFQGAVQGHFKTIIWDVFAQFDRQYGYRYATCLGYRAGRYEGGLIDHSRDFCIERNGQLFTFDEIKAFGTPDDKYEGYTNKSIGEFEGKTRFDYNPFFDMGGYNCRHAFNYIPDRAAIRYRPELKEVFAEEDKRKANA